MKTIICLISCVLASCSNDIAGFTPQQRYSAYAIATTLSGNAEYLPLIYGARRMVTSEKNPCLIGP